MNPTFTPRLTRLEDRTVPADFGNPWLDSMHVTLSFAPDGTDIVGAPSDLSTHLAALSPSARLDILRAFQSWVVHANLNVGLVADGGQSFTTGGAIQGDARFGDIRIGGRALHNDVLAITAPFNLFGSNSGNVVLNTAPSMASDLFTVFLQEAGHAFGIDNSPNRKSVMYEWYRGARAGLAAEDIAAIQALYGARAHDAYEGASGNNTLATATRVSGSIEADLTTAADVDVYRFTAPWLTLGTRITLKAEGLSLLTAKLELLDSAGQVVDRAITYDPLSNDLMLDARSLQPGSTYYVRVSAARNDVFGIGSYQLDVNHYSVLSDLVDTVNLLSTELGLNDTLETATRLTGNVVSLGARVDYVVRASLVGPADLDYYRIRSPQAIAGEPVNLVAAVWSLGGRRLQPRLDVYDTAGRLIPSRVLTNDGTNFVLQIENLRPDTDYLVRVKSGGGLTGNYAMSADFRADRVEFSLGSEGTLTQSANRTSAALTVAQSQQFHFVLAATTDAPSRDGALEMLIRNAAGEVVFRLIVDDGDAKSGDVFLAAGEYTVELRAFSKSGSFVRPITYQLSGQGITDPVGVSQADTTSSPQGGTGPSSGGGTTSDQQQTSSWSTTSDDSGTFWY